MCPPPGNSFALCLCLTRRSGILLLAWHRSFDAANCDIVWDRNALTDASLDVKRKEAGVWPSPSQPRQTQVSVVVERSNRASMFETYALFHRKLLIKIDGRVSQGKESLLGHARGPGCPDAANRIPIRSAPSSLLLSLIPLKPDEAARHSARGHRCFDQSAPMLASRLW